jgi:hypothetical protein
VTPIDHHPTLRSIDAAILQTEHDNGRSGAHNPRNYHLREARDTVERMIRRDHTMTLVVSELVAALSAYVGIVGNTGYSLTKDTARELYEAGRKALNNAVLLNSIP